MKNFIAYTILCAALVAVGILAVNSHDTNLRGVYNNFTPVNSSTTVGTSTTVVFSAGTAATCRRVFNDSTSTVYCALSNTVSSTLNAGFRLSAPTSSMAGPTSLTLGCGDNDFRPDRLTCIAAAPALVDTSAY